jgi:hypothetical protein
MYRLHLVLVAGLVLLAATLTGQAGTLPADALPLPNRVAAADLVIVGKVTTFEDKTVSAPTFLGSKTKADYKIAVITLSDAVPAPKGLKTVRLGFVPTPAGVAVSPPPFEPVVGQEGCFFLSKHGEADFYVAPLRLNFLDKGSPTFDKDIALVKRCATILADPSAALKAKDNQDRFLAAAMLVYRYTTRKGPNPKSEPIDAEQSKLILEALAAADWTPTTDFTQLSPRMVLSRLPLTAKDGWMPPADPKAYAAYAQRWLTDRAGTYRIQRFVTEPVK